jgi:hypothetical protein
VQAETYVYFLSQDLPTILGPFWLLAGHIPNNLYINNWDLQNLYALIKRKWQRKRKGYAPIE